MAGASECGNPRVSSHEQPRTPNRNFLLNFFSASLVFWIQAKRRCGVRHGRRANLRSDAPSTEEPQS